MRIKFPVFLSLLLLFSCTGAGRSLEFKNLRYPVSMTGSIALSSEGKSLILRQGDYKRLKAFNQRLRIWSIFYSWIPLTSKEALSTKLNNLVANNKGEGIVNFSLISKPCSLNYYWPLSFLPFYPGCTNLLLFGEVIKLTDQKVANSG